MSRLRVNVIGQLYSALLWDEPIARNAQVWPMIARESHSFTCYTHEPYLPLLPSRRAYHHPLAVTHCAYPQRVNRGCWLYTD